MSLKCLPNNLPAVVAVWKQYTLSHLKIRNFQIYNNLLIIMMKAIIIIIIIIIIITIIIVIKSSMWHVLLIPELQKKNVRRLTTNRT